jgi:hypothetical protein
MYFVLITLTNGQSYCLNSCFTRFFTRTYKQFRLKIDYFSNRLWEILDEPKLYINLKRFERRYQV